MNSFEILEIGILAIDKSLMNYKLEKFWNMIELQGVTADTEMNYKLEKFWNEGYLLDILGSNFMNYKLEKFWNSYLWWKEIEMAKYEL